ncbi:unnamed protein product [Parnassius apollo]|uniref:(apollo) hypothetical protein n=1 Tax=Parnassius apollo TaxID=110799 RepID=A0A8S3XF43_PARAO|nr:unnamed protein product [Parnassius apollo]
MTLPLREFCESNFAFDMPQQIKNGFKKCGLFPLDEEAVDYTKCVKDNAKLRNQRSSTGITSPDIDIAMKVIRAANLDIKHGIDTNVILKELNDMKSKPGRRKFTSKIKSSQKSTPKFTNSPDENVHILDTPKVGSYVTLDDISVITFDLSDSKSIITETEIAFLNYTDLGSNIQRMSKTHEHSNDILSNWTNLSEHNIYSQDIDRKIEVITDTFQSVTKDTPPVDLDLQNVI